MFQHMNQLVAMHIPALFNKLKLSRILLFYRSDGMYQILVLTPIPQTPCTSTSVMRSSPMAINHPDRKTLGLLDTYAGRLILDMELCEIARVA